MPVRRATLSSAAVFVRLHTLIRHGCPGCSQFFLGSQGPAISLIAQASGTSRSLALQHEGDAAPTRAKPTSGQLYRAAGIGGSRVSNESFSKR